MANIDEDLIIRKRLILPLVGGGIIILSPEGIVVPGSSKLDTYPKLEITKAGIKGYDNQGNLKTWWDASTGELHCYGYTP